ncbi:hypothetical protein [Arcanobacterium buesumense]|uniref:Uncharacterized protein n=1 Tax=Arcanobacterium buesumense TaxID=2722751 RepID=A0A6H2EJA7_9ACTO|nr:hypothetical protein [Arcanobacterium buesumense]QJC21224.1 hypothetical protein HC352_00925 [Arcanobacterium buesumense]
MFSNDPQKSALAELLRPIIAKVAPESMPSSAQYDPAGITQQARELRALLLSYDGAILAGHVMLDLLEENGYGPLDVEILTVAPENLALALAIQHAAASRGLAYDVVVTENGELLGPEASGRTAVAITLFDDETATEPGIPVETRAALIGTGLAAYLPSTLQSGDHRE